ncbi:BNR/Asp-box repeat protein [Lignipirellula cremea]|uniref:BNR/Asp-box repeat protein n=1 Tax=Lignipirellula cremea TaxID=2528010 RepID=A0A518DKL0_9BACT|nr:BNR/Asp-box repeat protein [Lignipirellula cremea]
MSVNEQTRVLPRKKAGTFLPFIIALLLPPVATHAAESDPSASDLALQPAHLIVSPWKQHIPVTKRQGVAGIERTAKGRLWVVYGRDVESPRNFQVLRCSEDDGKTWSEVKLMILPREGTRAMSANVWIDPQDRLWVFWGQASGLQDGRFGIFAVVCDDPDAAELKWSAPRRLGDGILLNKPTVLTNGEWLLTSSVWKADNSIKVYSSTDQGKTFELRGTANIEEAKTRGPDEPMIVERKDSSLWMMVRCQGLAETISQDGGRTWTPVKRIAIPHCTSRFFLRRLQSGALLLVKHGPMTEKVKREKLTAFISDDDGKTWQGGLMLDERDDVTYPDGVQAADGTIHTVYDHQRTPLGDVLMSTFTEEDVRAGKSVTDKVRLQVLIDHLPEPQN